MPLYFARCLRGLEGLAREEIFELTQASLDEEEIRTLFFTYEGNTSELLMLRSVDDVFFHLGEIKGLDHTRASLQRLPDELRRLNFSFSPFIKEVEKIRKISKIPSFTLTVGLQGKKNFSRFEVAAYALPVFKEKLQGEYILNEPGSQGAELDIRLLMEGDTLQIGLRLSERPLHRRPYKLHNLPGSTKPPLAYAMARLADIQPEDVVLDPCCGVGTLLIEASLAFLAKEYKGMDINSKSIELATKNAEFANQDIQFESKDVRTLSIPDACIDRVITNPPWGRQVSKPENLNSFYLSLFTQIARVLKSGGLMLVLTDHSSWMQNYLQSSQSFQVKDEVELSLFGSVVNLYVLYRR